MKQTAIEIHRKARIFTKISATINQKSARFSIAGYCKTSMQLNDVFIHDFDDVLKVIIWCLCAQQLRNHSVTVNCCERIIKIIKMKTCNCLRPIGSLTNCTSYQTWMTLGWWRNLNGTNQKNEFVSNVQWIWLPASFSIISCEACKTIDYTHFTTKYEP